MADESLTNLQRMLGFKRISVATVQRVIGVKQDKTAREKINRERDFKLPEAKAIKDQLFPEYDFDYLFDGYTESVNHQREASQ